MKLPITVLAATALSFPATAAEVRQVMGSIITAPESPATLAAKCDIYINEVEARRSALVQANTPPSIETTLVQFDRLMILLRAGGGEFALYRQVMGTPELREAGAECEVRLETMESSIGLSREIYEQLAAIDPSGADEETRFYLTKVLTGFERNGVALPEAERGRVQAINEELAELSANFARNIAEDIRELRVMPEELQGLPADFLSARPAGADGMITLTTATTDYQPVMRYAESDDVRRRFSEIYNQRAFPQNDDVLRRIFTLRQELAELLGRPNYAALVLEDKMLSTPAQVETLIADMAAIAGPVAERDIARNMQVLRTLRPDAERIEFWQTGWLSPKVQEALFNYDPQEARRYFAYNDVNAGILRLTEDLFGVEIRAWDTPVWHEDVLAYEMLDGDEVIGRFYFDNHPRPGKYTHANMIPIYPGVIGGEPPVAALVQNMPAGDHATGLMEHSQVTTMLHEFGHMLHGMFGGRQRWFGQSGITTEWDFVEAPSQMLENWVYDYDTLASFARDAAGDPIPRDLVERMNAARSFNQGFGDMVQLGYTNVSLQFHQNPVPADMGAATREWFGHYGPIPMPDFVQMQSAFGHLDGYSAIYYTYRWSKVIADDLFTRFQSEGLRNRETAEEYRRAVLDRGGTRPAAELVRAFLGRDVTLDAYRAELERGLD
jgi:thimet oligopeptidase